MPSQTAGGLPYPLPTEPVKEGAVAIRNLAEATDRRIYPVNYSVVAIDKTVTTDVNGFFMVPWSPLLTVIGGMANERTVGDYNTSPTILRIVQLNNGGGQATVRAFNPSTLGGRGNYGIEYSAIFWGFD